MNTFEIVRIIGEAPKELLNGIETSVLTRMAFFGDRYGKNIKPGLENLISQLKFSRSSVKRSISSLIKKGILIDRTIEKFGVGNVSTYEINLSSFIDYKGSTQNPLKGPQGTLKRVHREPFKDEGKLVKRVHTEPFKGSTGNPLPYTPHIEPLELNHILESGADSRLVSAPKKILKIKKSWKGEILEIFDYWQKVMNHPGSKIDKKRFSKIESALKHGFTVEQLKKAIDGNKKSSFHQGKNESGTIYDSITLIFRNPEKVEEFICKFDSEIAPKNKNGTTALKSTFLDNSRNQIKALDKLGEVLFPEFIKSNVSNKPKEISVNESD
jgi:hypothetical protein